MDSIVLDPAVEVSNNVRALSFNAERREGLQFLETDSLLFRASDAAVSDLDSVFEAVCFILALEHLTKVAPTNSLDPIELFVKP